jgi:hypothetical protein
MEKLHQIVNLHNLQVLQGKPLLMQVHILFQLSWLVLVCILSFTSNIFAIIVIMSASRSPLYLFLLCCSPLAGGFLIGHLPRAKEEIAEGTRYTNLFIFIFIFLKKTI